MALSHASCSSPAASSIVFVSFLLATGAALWETGGLPFGALRQAMPSVHTSVRPRCQVLVCLGSTDVTELPASKFFGGGLLTQDLLSCRA